MNKAPKLIGLVGKKGSGKDTFFDILKAAVGGRVERLAFADPLKDEVRQLLFATTGENYSRDGINANKEKFRGLLQWWGEYRRNHFGKDYWIKQAQEALARLRHQEDPPEVIIFTDVRYLNEAVFIGEEEGRLIKVIAVGFPTGPSKPEEDTHPSETELEDIGTSMQLYNIFGKRELFALSVINAYVALFGKE